jgi:sorbitol-specific phosphotransferase system component IIC
MPVALVSIISITAALKPSIAACAVAESGHTIIVREVLVPVAVALKLGAPAAYTFGHIASPVAVIASMSENSQSVKVANIFVFSFSFAPQFYEKICTYQIKGPAPGDEAGQVRKRACY